MPNKLEKNQEKVNLTDSLEKLNEIVSWFEEQDNVDVEAGLGKVREAAVLIKASKSRLAEIENEFKEIEKEIGDDHMSQSPNGISHDDDMEF